MPYNEALGTTLIERSFRERIILVGVTLPPDMLTYEKQPPDFSAVAARWKEMMGE